MDQSGQIRSRHHTTDFPQNVAFWKGNPLISEKSRLVKYYNLARSMCVYHKNPPNSLMFPTQLDVGLGKRCPYKKKMVFSPSNDVLQPQDLKKLYPYC